MKFVRNSSALAVVLAAAFAFAQSGSQKAFDSLKTLAGTWEGKNQHGQTVKVAFRNTAGGSALLSEILGDGPENMVSMIHLDGDRLLLTHYCGAGNQPRMKATGAPDGRSVAFDYVDATNLSAPDAGHMNRVVFSMPDSDHHSEEWTFLDHGKVTKEVFTLERVKLR
jgi:hypothetical protein